METKAAIVNHITLGETEKAIDLFILHTSPMEDRKMYKIGLTLKGRFTFCQECTQTGTVSLNDFQIEKNRIHSIILDQLLTKEDETNHKIRQSLFPYVAGSNLLLNFVLIVWILI